MFQQDIVLGAKMIGKGMDEWQAWRHWLQEWLTLTDNNEYKSYTYVWSSLT